VLAYYFIQITQKPFAIIQFAVSDRGFKESDMLRLDAVLVFFVIALHRTRKTTQDILQVCDNPMNFYPKKMPKQSAVQLVLIQL